MKKPTFILFALVFLALFAPVARGQVVDPGFAHFRNTALSSTDVAIKTSTSNLFGFTIINVNTVPVYVKFYNGTVANVVVGTTTPAAVVMVPAGNGTTPGCLILAPGTISWLFSSMASSVAAVTGIADSSTAAPSIAIYMEAQYK